LDKILNIVAISRPNLKLDRLPAKTMNLDQWCELDERIYVAESDERYKQYAGLKHSERIIEQLAEMKNINAQIFLDTFSSEPKEAVPYCH
jgi:hypothetical protein